MTPQRITQTNLLAALEAAVAEKGEDYVYKAPMVLMDDGCHEPESACVYFEAGKPSCIFGHALATLGYGPEDISENTNIGDILIDMVDVPENVYCAADSAQAAQDRGHTWGEALRLFKSCLTDTCNITL